MRNLMYGNLKYKKCKQNVSTYIMTWQYKHLKTTKLSQKEYWIKKNQYSHYVYNHKNRL